MGCLLVLFGAMFPRIAVVLIWLARPAIVSAAFDTVLIPILGIVFLPFTTLIYLVLYTPGVGLTGWDWLWLGLAVVLDVTHLGASSYDAAKETGWRTS